MEGYIQGREGVCEKRTRESFHLWVINAEEHLHYKSEGLARPDISSLLPRIPRTMSYTSVDALAFIAGIRDINTRCLVQETSQIIDTEVKMKGGHRQIGG